MRRNRLKVSLMPCFGTWCWHPANPLLKDSQGVPLQAGNLVRCSWEFRGWILHAWPLQGSPQGRQDWDTEVLGVPALGAGVPALSHYKINRYLPQKVVHILTNYCHDQNFEHLWSEKGHAHLFAWALCHQENFYSGIKVMSVFCLSAYMNLCTTSYLSSLVKCILHPPEVGKHCIQGSKDLRHR